MDNPNFLKHQVKQTLNLIKNEISLLQLQWERFIKTNDNKKHSQKISRSYYKLKEIFYDIPYFSDLQNKNQITRMHLAEAPGGFIQFCNDFFQSDLYHTISIKSTNKIIPSYNSIVNQDKRINFLTNDITDIRVINHLTSLYSNSYDIVTGDGGIFLNNEYTFQEQKSIKLIASEIYIALHLLKLNGSCIIKFFDTFTSTSNILIYILKKHFKYLYLHKPSSSRNTNSEKYIIAINLKKKRNSFLQSLHLLSTIILSKYEDLSLDNEIKQKIILFTPHFIDSIKSLSCENTLKYNCILPNRQGQHILNILNEVSHNQ